MENWGFLLLKSIDWIGIGNTSVDRRRERLGGAHFQISSRAARAFHNSLTHSKRTGLEHCTKRGTRPVYVVCRLLHVYNRLVVFRRGGVIRSEVRSQGESPGQHTLDTSERLDQTLPRDLTINIWMVHWISMTFLIVGGHRILYLQFLMLIQITSFLSKTHILITAVCNYQVLLKYVCVLKHIFQWLCQIPSRHA